MRPLLPTLAACLALGACTQAQWANPRTGTANAEADLAACTSAAQRGAFLYPPSARPGPRLLPFADRDLENPAWDMPQDVLVQQNFRNLCMRNKGYQLVPRQTAEAPSTP